MYLSSTIPKPFPSRLLGKPMKVVVVPAHHVASRKVRPEVSTSVLKAAFFRFSEHKSSRGVLYNIS